MAAIAVICEVGIEGSKYFPPGSDLISLDIKDLFKYLHSASLNLYWNTIACYYLNGPSWKNNNYFLRQSLCIQFKTWQSKGQFIASYKMYITIMFENDFYRIYGNN